jgi:enoyl-CoA hydratase
MSEELVRLSQDGPVATLTVNRPDSLNALNQPTLEALASAIEQVGAAAPRCLIVTGAGDKAFVAGADIAAMREMSPEQGAAFARLGQRTFAALEALPLPVIAAVNGFALGGGTELALACDFIYASDKAKFGQPEVKLGIIPGFGGTQRLARRIGLGVARELIYTGRMIGPEEALRVGLANAVVPRRGLLERVGSVAQEIAAVGPGAVASAKRVMLAGAHRPLGEAIELEAEAFGECFAWEDQKEGMSAFLAKRSPDFKNR